MQINGKDFHGEDLRRSNFTAASCRNCNFKDTKLQGTYFIKAVVAKANFEASKCIPEVPLAAIHSLRF